MKRIWFLILVLLALVGGIWLYRHGWRQSIGGPGGLVGRFDPGSSAAPSSMARQPVIASPPASAMPAPSMPESGGKGTGERPASAPSADVPAEQPRPTAAAEPSSNRSPNPLWQQLLEELDLIMPTRATSNGLIVHISDVLFDFSSDTLRPSAKEKLAVIAGLIHSHPGLKVAVYGYPGVFGNDIHNVIISRQRAELVRSYLIEHGMPPDKVSAGFEIPTDSDGTATRRQQDRYVELVISGDIIGR